MSARQFDHGWRAGYEAMLNRLGGYGYSMPGMEKPDDYRLGFAAGQEAALWWWRGWEDGYAGRRVRRDAPEVFVANYWVGYKAATADRHEQEARRAA